MNIKTSPSHFPSVLGHINIKNHSKIDKSFEGLTHIPQLCHSKFRLIILKEKFRCKFQGMDIEKGRNI